jgi:hypothetical protein
LITTLGHDEKKDVENNESRDLHLSLSVREKRKKKERSKLELNRGFAPKGRVENDNVKIYRIKFI